MSAKALILHMNILWDKAFSWEQTILTLWPWPLTFDQLLKNFILLITFE